jgi:HPt (histidine-containing phosphotransfer) domain-containing protein
MLLWQWGQGNLKPTCVIQLKAHSMQHLLNLTTMNQLAQLEGRLPGFLSRQLQAFENEWPNSIKLIQGLVGSAQILEICDIVHKMAGHAQILGFKAVGDQLAQLEQDLMNAATSKADGEADGKDDFKSDIGSLNALLEDLTSLKTHSVRAVRSHISSLQEKIH